MHLPETSDPGFNNVVLVVATTPLPAGAFAEIARMFPERRVVYLAMYDGERGECVPANWEELTVAKLTDDDRLRRDLLSFVESWPRRVECSGQTFNEAFTDADGHPLWWMGPGSQRGPLSDPFRSMTTLWYLSRAREEINPGHVLLHTDDSRLSAILASSFEDAESYGWVSGSADPTDLKQAWQGRCGWFVRSALRIFNVSWKCVRMMLRDAVCSTGKAPVDRPVVVATTEYPRHYRYDDGPAQWYWNDLIDSLQAIQPNCDVRLLPQLLVYTVPDRRLPTSLSKLKNSAGQKSLIRRCSPRFNARAAISIACRFVRQLSRYLKLEATANYRRSFQFCGADVSSLYIAEIRRMLSRMLDWELGVSSVCAGLQSAGDVRAVLVHVEMYSAGMTVNAACRRLRIPTVGVQHGSIYPMHLIYTLPESAVREAPIPDFFACYGQFASSVLVDVGRYPAERVKIVGGSRLDHLVNHRKSRRECRAAAGLPADKCVLLVTASAISWEPEAVRHLLDSVADDPTVCVVIKISPTGLGETKYRALAEEYMSRVDVRIYLDQIDLLLRSCDILASVVSTTILEAALLGKPTICFNYTGHSDWYPFASEGLSIAAVDAPSTRRAVAEARDPRAHEARAPQRREFLARHVGPTVDGRGGLTFAKWIDDRFLRGKSRGLPNDGSSNDALRDAA